MMMMMMIIIIIIIISEFIAHDVHANEQVKLLCIIIYIYIYIIILHSICRISCCPHVGQNVPQSPATHKRLSRSCINNTYDLDRNGQPIR